MLTSFRTLGVSAAVLAALVLVPATSFAAELRGGNQTVVGSNEVITNDLYIAGGSVTSSGVIQGDLTAAGGTVLVTGPVSQDITVAGGTLTILGTVGGSIRATGGNITVSSSVKNDVVAAGGLVQIAGGQVGRDVVVAGGTVRIDSPVTGNVRFIGAELFINAPVSGNVEADAQKVTLGSAAVISGTLTYKASQEVVMEKGAQVKGAVTYTPKGVVRADFKKGMAAFFAFWVIAKFLMLLAGALVIGLCLRRFSTEAVADAFSHSYSEIGRGLVVLIVLPVASVLLLVTVIGVPFGVLGLISLAALIIVSSLFTPILIGSALYKWAMKGTDYEISWKTIVLGVVAYFVFGFIPVLGWIADFVFWLIALGAIVHIKWGELQEWR